MTRSRLLTTSAIFVFFAAACGDGAEEKAPNSTSPNSTMSADAGSDASEIDAGNDDAGDNGACDPGLVENVGGECVVGDHLYLFFAFGADGAYAINGFPLTADLRTFESAEIEQINEYCSRSVDTASPVDGPEPEEPPSCWDIGLLTISSAGTEVDVPAGDDCYSDTFNPRFPVDDPITFSFEGSSDFAGGEFTMQPHAPPVVAVRELPDGTVEIERENPEAFETWAVAFSGLSGLFTCSGETDVITLSPDDIAEVGPLSDYSIEALHVRVDGVGSSETDTTVLVSLYARTPVELPAD